MVKPPVRTKSIGTKVSDEEYAQLEKLAQSHGQTLGEWCRDVMLEHVDGRKPSVIEETLLAEVLALRTILLNLHFTVAKGEAITAEANENSRATLESYRWIVGRNIPRQVIRRGIPWVIR
jgi:hypothetical protein